MRKCIRQNSGMCFFRSEIIAPKITSHISDGIRYLRNPGMVKSAEDPVIVKFTSDYSDTARGVAFNYRLDEGESILLYLLLWGCKEVTAKLLIKNF